MIIAGNGIYERCRDCGKLVKLNRWLFAGWHLCNIEALEARHATEATMRAQIAAVAQMTRPRP